MSALSKAVATAIRSDPSRWRQDGAYHFTRNDGLRVWVANGCSGLQVETVEGVRYWGVTFWCLIGGSPEQREVWSAYQWWKRRQLHRVISGIAQ